MASPSLDCRLAYASELAYSIAHDGSGFSIDPSTPHYGEVGFATGTAPACFAQGVDLINAGYVAETEDGWVLVVFRGTLPPTDQSFWPWVEDWLQDFEIGPVPWTVAGRPYGQVEGGFARAVHGLWYDVTRALGAIDLSRKRGIWVTGHSKGAALTPLAASLLRAQFPSVYLRATGFAMPLACDRSFRDAYDAAGLGAVTVRYQNEYDLVPFLPWVPTFALLATAERLDREPGVNLSVTPEAWPTNDYVELGLLEYITTSCQIESGPGAWYAAFRALEQALYRLEFLTVMEAHSLTGRYTTCVCG